MTHLPMTNDVLYLFLVLQSALRVIAMSCVCPLVRQSALRERDRLWATEAITLMSNILPIHLTSRMMRKGENMITDYDSGHPPTRHYDPEIRSSSWGSKPSSRSSSSTSSTSHPTKFSTSGSRIFHTELGVSIYISIPSIDGIICIPTRREQRTPYHSTLVPLVVIDREMTSSSNSCSQPLCRRSFLKLTVGLQIGWTQRE